MAVPQAPAGALLKKVLALPECPSALLFISSDSLRRNRAVDLLLEKFAGAAIGPKTVRPFGDKPKERAGGVEINRLRAPELAAGGMRALRDGVGNLSLFAKRRFFLIEQSEDLTADIQKDLLSLIEKLGSDTRLIFLATSLAAASPLRKALQQREGCLVFEDLRGAELQKWIEKELKRAEFVSWPESLPSLLALMEEESIDAIAKDVELLRLYCEGEKITQDEMHALFIQRGAVGEFEYLDTVSQGKIAAAETLLGELLGAGKNAFQLLALISRSFVNYTGVKALQLQNAGLDAMKDRLGLSPWVLNKHLGTVRNFSLRRLARAISAVVRADSKLKNRSLGAEAIFGELSASLSSRSRR